METKTFFSQGNNFLRNNQIPQAIECYQKAIDNNPKFSLYYENLAIALYMSGDIEQAKEVMLKAFHLSSDSSKIRLKNSKEYYDLGLYNLSVIKDINLNIDDLIAKLWGGFSKCSLIALDSCFGSSKYTNKDKSKAAFNLARWYTSQNNPSTAINYINKLKKYDISLYRSKKIRLLWIDSLIKKRNFSKAEEIIYSVLNNRDDFDFNCSLSNLLIHTTNDNQERLNCINQIYIKSKLEPISLIDNNKGLVFGNINYITPTHTIDTGPKISILVPVFEAFEYLEVAIKSLLCQSWKNLEIIAIDDCSSDNSWEKLQELSKLDNRLKIFRNEINMGAYATRNKALSLATGDFITIHDSDDWSHPQMLEKQIQVMINDPKIKITCSFMTRVFPNLEFMLRPQRNNLEYIHRSYPSTLIRAEDIKLLGEWDTISANADDEFIQRARVLWGENVIYDVMPAVPFSFFLVHENSLTQQTGTNLKSVTFGIRHEYSRQANHWRKKNAFDTSLLKIKRTSYKKPFPIPQNLGAKHWEKNHKYDLVLISDFGLLGGTRRCNEGYIQAAIDLGWRVGLFHWPRYDLKLAKIDDIYTDFSYHENVDFLVPEDEIEADAIIIHHPPILKFEIDDVPKIIGKKLGILVNQSPMQLWSQDAHYYHSDAVDMLCRKLFSLEPTWIPISERVLQTLAMTNEYYNIYKNIWYPPLNANLPPKCPEPNAEFGGSRKIIVGRHARDHWTKWPEKIEDLKKAFCVDSPNIEVNIMGGVNTPINILGSLPKNWKNIEFDKITAKQFVNKLDFFIHYTHSDYIEEFGRNIMEAMAGGRVVILPPIFQDIFKDAAIYAPFNEVDGIINNLWLNKDAYLKQAILGFNFVQQNCTLDATKHNLINFIK